MSKIDEILNIKLEDVGTKVYKLIDANKAKAELLQLVLEVIGDDEIQPRPIDDESRARFYRVGGKNFLRNEQRQKAYELFGEEQ